MLIGQLLLALRLGKAENVVVKSSLSSRLEDTDWQKAVTDVAAISNADMKCTFPILFFYSLFL